MSLQFIFSSCLSLIINQNSYSYKTSSLDLTLVVCLISPNPAPNEHFLCV